MAAESVPGGGLAAGSGGVGGGAVEGGEGGEGGAMGEKRRGAGVSYSNG